MSDWVCNNCNLSNPLIYPACSDCGHFKPIEINNNSTLAHFFSSMPRSEVSQIIRNRNNFTSQTNFEDIKFQIIETEWKRILDNSKGNKLGGECLYCTRCFLYKQAVVMPCCGKRVHKSCIKKWLFEHKPICPLCRHEYQHQRIVDQESKINSILEQHYSS